MADDTIFETRLAAALGRYAELAPTMDDETIARVAIDARRTARPGWLAALRNMLLGPITPSTGTRVAYLVVLLALLLAAILVAVAGGFFRNKSLPLPGRNGAIVYSFGGNNHEAVANVAIDPDGTGDHPDRRGSVPDFFEGRGGARLALLRRRGIPRRHERRRVGAAHGAPRRDTADIGFVRGLARREPRCLVQADASEPGGIQFAGRHAGSPGRPH